MIEETLYAALTADATLTALVGDRVYPCEVPDDETQAPWLFYLIPESVPLDQLDAANTPVRSEAEFHALADTYKGARAVIDAVAAVLKTNPGGTITAVLWRGTSNEVTEDGYHQSIRFAVWWIMP